MFNSLLMRILFFYVGLLFASFAFAQSKDLLNYDSIIKATSIGKSAPNFIRKDIDGKTLCLSEFRGKYVLLDYWASWCEPCRKLTPSIRKLYKKYHSKGLEVISISCDNEYEEWEKAIKQDSIEAFHNILSFTDEDMALAKGKNGVEVLRSATFKDELRKKFNLMPIPVEILIDSNGIIIGRYLNNDTETYQDLEKKLDELF